MLLLWNLPKWVFYFQDFVATTNLTAAYEELDTDRVVRIAAKKFPHYFAILSRVREEVRVTGGRIWRHQFFLFCCSA